MFLELQRHSSSLTSVCVDRFACEKREQRGQFSLCEKRPYIRVLSLVFGLRLEM